MAIKKGSMKEAINSIYQVLINDEELLRLLYYPPFRIGNLHDPLDESLENILDKSVDEMWDIVNDRIVLGEKVSDLVDKELCRIYVSLGRRRPVHNTYLLTKQEVMLSVYIHENYNDMRLESISDRISELIALERISGMGMLDYVAGNPRADIRQYQRFDHVYEFMDSKK